MCMNNTVYDVLSKAQRWLPSLGLFYLALAKTWALPYGSAVSDTVAAVSTLLAATLEISSGCYYRAEGARER